ncbi:hypothetical protein LC986_15460, partial [Enterococcus faecium]|nr:hypothetical protein [Enterococcus faecium]
YDILAFHCSILFYSEDENTKGKTSTMIHDYLLAGKFCPFLKHKKAAVSLHFPTAFPSFISLILE